MESRASWSISPVTGADVVLLSCCDDLPVIHKATDGRGGFAFEVPRGTFTLKVRRGVVDDFDDRDDRVVTAGSRDVRLALP